jgi:membrane fusion protein (multidrug efflux system)
MKRTRMLLMSLVLGSILFAPGCSPRPADSEAAGQKKADAAAILVNASDIVLSESRRLESGISFSGELTPQEVTEMTARFEGDLESVPAREGERVHKGQALAVFKPRDVRDAGLAADAQLQSAKAALIAAENGERRAKKLLEAGAAAPSDLETAEAARSAAQAQVRAAEALSNRAKENADRLDVPAPYDGWVSKVYVHSGGRTAVGDPLITVVNTDVMELSVTLPSEALSRVSPGTPIRFKIDAFPAESFEGKVDRINPTTEPGTRQVRLYTRIPNADHKLVGGLYASGRVVVDIKENAVAAPATTLRKEGQDQVVYRLRGGSAQRLTVQMGLVDEQSGWVELIGSVGPGDSLLTGVVPGLQDGVKIRVLRTNGGQNPDSAK